MAESRCIMCGQKKAGLRVKEDNVISLMRWFKRNVTKNEKGYTLVVCKEDYPKYYKQRKRFESRRALYVALGAVFAVFMFAVGANKPLALLYGAIIVAFFYLLSHLTYMPAVEMPAQRARRR
ncbi:MAG: hypothetical protein LVQ95_01385 [Candidatus Micrarchaeales archaeon]|nr:hypothetical protein [Candidatus Micrarchaeales archaeon]